MTQRKYILLILIFYTSGLALTRSKDEENTVFNEQQHMTYCTLSLFSLQN